MNNDEATAALRAELFGPGLHDPAPVYEDTNVVWETIHPRRPSTKDDLDAAYTSRMVKRIAKRKAEAESQTKKDGPAKRKAERAAKQEAEAIKQAASDEKYAGIQALIASKVINTPAPGLTYTSLMARAAVSHLCGILTSPKRF